jgi:hypothetical protein
MKLKHMILMMLIVLLAAACDSLSDVKLPVTGTLDPNATGDTVDCHATDELVMVRVALPASAADIHWQCTVGLNASYDVNFLMAPEDLNAFQNSTRITEWRADATGAVRFVNEAQTMTSLMFGTYADAAVMDEILIDTSDPARYKVYYHSVMVE